MATAGDALIFTHALWHGGAVNRSSVTRKNIQYGYNQMFFRNYDYGERVPESVLASRHRPASDGSSATAARTHGQPTPSTRRATTCGSCSATEEPTMHALAPPVQYGWSTRDPIATVASGAELDLEFRDASDGQVTRTSTVDVLDTYENGRGNPITGPIVVEGAQPGDVLQVDILDFEVDTWGWTCFVPGFGLLDRRLPEARPAPLGRP